MFYTANNSNYVVVLRGGDLDLISAHIISGRSSEIPEEFQDKEYAKMKLTEKILNQGRD